jgi:hypothetical protein
LFDVERLPFDVERLLFAVGRLPFDVERLSFDVERLPFDIERLPFDGEWLPFDVERFVFDGERLPFDVERFVFDGESEGIAQIEEVESAKVCVPGVERRHAMLQEDGGKVGIRNKIAANRAAGNRFVDREETFLLAECPRMWQR